MDLLDFLTTSAGEGGRYTRIFGALVGALLGGLIGWFILPDVFDIAPVSSGTIAALVGGGLGALFAFAIVVFLIIALMVAGIIGFQSMTGAG